MDELRKNFPESPKPDEVFFICMLIRVSGYFALASLNQWIELRSVEYRSLVQFWQGHAHTSVAVTVTGLALTSSCSCYWYPGSTAAFDTHLTLGSLLIYLSVPLFMVRRKHRDPNVGGKRKKSQCVFISLILACCSIISSLLCLNIFLK